MVSTDIINSSGSCIKGTREVMLFILSRCRDAFLLTLFLPVSTYFRVHIDVYLIFVKDGMLQPLYATQYRLSATSAEVSQDVTLS